MYCKFRVRIKKINNNNWGPRVHMGAGLENLTRPKRTNCVKNSSSHTEPLERYSGIFKHLPLLYVWQNAVFSKEEDFTPIWANFLTEVSVLWSSGFVRSYR